MAIVVKPLLAAFSFGVPPNGVFFTVVGVWLGIQRVVAR